MVYTLVGLPLSALSGVLGLYGECFKSINSSDLYQESCVLSLTLFSIVFCNTKRQIKLNAIDFRLMGL